MSDRAAGFTAGTEGDEGPVSADVVVQTAGPLITCDPVRGGLGILEGGVVAARGGRVAWVGSATEAPAELDLLEGASVWNVGSRVVIPGIVECHSHPVFGGSRAAEFQMRAAGRSYEEIAAAGGGIMSTVRATREAGYDDLVAAGRRHLDWMLDFGVTTVEAKSGYGLTAADEIRLLEVIGDLADTHSSTVVPTFLGAHTVPVEHRTDPGRYVDMVVEDMLPAVAERGLARFCDVFCEDVAFDVAQSRRVLEAALDLGLKVKVHAEQLTPSGGARLAAEMGAVSAEHLDYVEGDGIEALAEAGVTAVLLPGAVFFLGRTHFAPARSLLDAAVPVALSTDFNPGTSYTENPYLIGTMASAYMGMSVEEVILGLTLRAAGALDMVGEVGSLAPGLRGDLVVLDTDDHLSVPYHFGINPVLAVFKDGEVVRGRTELEAMGARRS